MIPALPDALTGLLTGTPYSYNVMAAADLTPVGGKFNEAGVRQSWTVVPYQSTHNTGGTIMGTSPRNSALAGAVAGVAGTAASIGGPYFALVLQHGH